MVSSCLGRACVENQLHSLEALQSHCHAALTPLQDALEAMEDVREYDVPFHMRWAIDTGVRCGWWYTVKATVRRMRPSPQHEHHASHVDVISRCCVELSCGCVGFRLHRETELSGRLPL